MTEINSMVQKLQKEAIDANVSVSNLLRQAKLIATELKQEVVLNWIDKEQKGYGRDSIEGLPSYRKLQGIPAAQDTFGRWAPIRFQASEDLEIASAAPIFDSVGTLELRIKDKTESSFHIPFLHEIDKQLRNSIRDGDILAATGISLDGIQIWAIVETVRNLIYDWSLDLRKAGIIGADMVFTELEKEKAEAPTQQLTNNINNYFTFQGNFVGNLNQNQNNITNDLTNNFNLDEVTDFLKQLEKVIPHLPIEIKSQIETAVEEVKEEVKKDHLEESKIKLGLKKIKDICEKAADNLITQGITQGIIGLFKNFV